MVKGVPVRVVAALVGLPPSQLISRRPLASGPGLLALLTLREPHEIGRQYSESMLRMGRGLEHGWRHKVL